jgi:hypothetical protein
VVKGSTTVCSASLAITCIDLSPSTTGPSTYTVRTNYTDGAGNPNYVSTNYSVAAPTVLPPAFEGNIGNVTACGTNSTTITVPSGGIAAGNRVVIRIYQRGGSTTGSVNASDSRGNNYSVDANYLTSTTVLSAHVSTALAAGDTIRVNYPTADAAGVVADAFSNVATANAVDASATANGTATSNPSVSLTTTSPTDLVIGAIGSANNRAVTQPSGWTGLGSSFPDCGGATRTGTIVGGYNAPGATGTVTYNPVLGGSGQWAGAAVAYNSGGASTLNRPSAPSGLTVTVNGDGTRTLAWTAPSGTPAVEFYRIYRDGRDYTDRIDTAGATGSSVTWTDTNTGNASHTYRVTAASATLIESDFAGPVTG